VNRKPLSFSAGRRGNRARVYQNIAGGPFWLTTTANPKPQPLEIRDFATAKARAWKEVEKGKVQRKNAVLGTVTLERALLAYRTEKDNAMCPSEESANQRRTALWYAVLGREKVVTEITKQEVADVQRKRITGEIDGRGRAVDEVSEPRLVSPQTASSDVAWLYTAIRFALEAQNPTLVKSQSPVAAFRVEKNVAPRRPAASEPRFRAIVKAAEAMTMLVYWGEEPQRVSAPIGALVQLLAFLGVRVSQALGLKASDLHLDRAQGCPFGYVRFRAGRKNKNPEPFEVPLTKESRPVVDQLLIEHLLRDPDAPDGFLFPSPRNRHQPMRVDVAANLHHKAEALANIGHLPGGVFHTYRRKFVSELAHISPTIAAATTGRQDLETMYRSYTQVPLAAKFKAMKSRRPLPEQH